MPVSSNCDLFGKIEDLLYSSIFEYIQIEPRFIRKNWAKAFCVYPPFNKNMISLWIFNTDRLWRLSFLIVIKIIVSNCGSKNLKCDQMPFVTCFYAFHRTSRYKLYKCIKSKLSFLNKRISPLKILQLKYEYICRHFLTTFFLYYHFFYKISCFNLTSSLIFIKSHLD